MQIYASYYKASLTGNLSGKGPLKIDRISHVPSYSETYTLTILIHLLQYGLDITPLVFPVGNLSTYFSFPLTFPSIVFANSSMCPLLNILLKKIFLLNLTG